MRRNTPLANPYIRAVHEVIKAHPDGITVRHIRKELREPTETVLGTDTVEGAMIRLHRGGHITVIGKEPNNDRIWGLKRIRRNPSETPYTGR